MSLEVAPPTARETYRQQGLLLVQKTCARVGNLHAWKPCKSPIHGCVQGRTILGKILFWKREAGRFVVRMGAHASKGWMEALMVAGAAFSFLVLVVLLGMCLITCCNALFSDEEPDVAAAAAKATRRFVTIVV
ncbi:unnamed protein product [Symbiodinium sp. CCMP2456]|nr:unnamed protein product [Symbiodinium sp. CCMP2456]